MVLGALGKRGGQRLASCHLRLAPVIQGAGPGMKVDPGGEGAGEETGAHAHHTREGPII